jgi:2-oxoglutarate ferredoxin oxidoreductase subunit alpha
MIVNSIQIMFGGQAGDGSLTTGDLLAGAFKRIGLEVSTHKDFPSRIRGGRTNYVIRALQRPNYGMSDAIDCLVAFDRETAEGHIAEMRPGGFVIFDSSSEEICEDRRRPDLTWYDVPLAKIAKEQLKAEVVRNTIALGVLCKLIGLDSKTLESQVASFWKNRHEGAAAANLAALAAGERYVEEHFADRPSGYVVRNGVDGDRLLMSGNDAIAYGALVGGCRFMSGYPITPATEILEWMSRHLPQCGGAALQVEDELSAINMALGAAYAGARAMTATSGPGLSLMTEAIGLAGVLEIPIVIVECARAGPSTGMPTKTEQSNLNHLIFGGHGEIPKAVIAPGTIEESFYFAALAFNLAEKYQLPVFVLTEQALCQSKATLPALALDAVRIERGKLAETVSTDYERFADTQDGVSPRVIPGAECGMHLASGSEHNPAGVITEGAENRVRMMEKRMRKLESMHGDLPKGKIFGDPSAEIAIVGWGANRGPIAEAQERLSGVGIATRFLQMRTLWPFPDDEVRNFISSARHVFVVENNFTGQLERLIRAVVGPLEQLHSVRKFDGRPFRPLDIVAPIERIVSADLIGVS